MALVKRSKKLLYYGVTENGNTVYRKMTKFTDLSISKNPKEYSRQYIDEDFEQTDVVSYAPEIAYTFDLHDDNAVHNDIANIHNRELIGSATVKSIIMVDFTTLTDAGNYYAVRRDFAVIPDSEGGSTDAYTYSGTMKAKGAAEQCIASSTDNFATCQETLEL